MSDATDWYEQKHRLRPQMIFLTKSGEVVQLDRSVPGDGTKWYVANLYIRGWTFEDGTVEPGDLLMEI